MVMVSFSGVWSPVTMATRMTATHAGMIVVKLGVVMVWSGKAWKLVTMAMPTMPTGV